MSIHSQTHDDHPALSLPIVDKVIEEANQMMKQYWEDYPDLYEVVQEKKKARAAKPSIATEVLENKQVPLTIVPPDAPPATVLRGAELRQRMYDHHCVIRENLLPTNSFIVPRTQASNQKCLHQTVEADREDRSTLLSAQVQAWRSMLPSVIRRFAKLPDYRQANSIQHKTTVLMMFGLLAFVFRLSSRREMNRELTGPMIMSHLKTLFPEIDTIPHADTLARFLEHTDPGRIEAIHISLIRDLITKKKFKKLLIQNHFPISIDGAQKLYRDGLRQDEEWCERTVGGDDDKRTQQYLYVLEANLTLKNGMTIPLMSEYLYRDHDALQRTEGKQDSETTAFERLAARLKKYFPRLKILVLMDAMFATQPIMGQLHDYHWQYLVRLPKQKLTDFAKQLNEQKEQMIALPDQPYYREQQQFFFWKNDITYGYEWQLKIHLIGCLEEYEAVDADSGDIVKKYSEHAWISSIAASPDILHELINLGGRKLWLIEHSFNTEKHQGYRYKHAFSYHWHAMQGFHYLMRLGHAIDAISELTKTLRKYIKKLGWSATLKLIKETLFAPWLPIEWYQHCHATAPELRWQLE